MKPVTFSSINGLVYIVQLPRRSAGVYYLVPERVTLLLAGTKLFLPALYIS